MNGRIRSAFAALEQEIAERTERTLRVPGPENFRQQDSQIWACNMRTGQNKVRHVGVGNEQLSKRGWGKFWQIYATAVA
jgi:hypothetical protein